MIKTSVLCLDACVTSYLCQRYWSCGSLSLLPAGPSPPVWCCIVPNEGWQQKYKTTLHSRSEPDPSSCVFNSRRVNKYWGRLYFIWEQRSVTWFHSLIWNLVIHLNQCAAEAKLLTMRLRSSFLIYIADKFSPNLHLHHTPSSCIIPNGYT